MKACLSVQVITKTITSPDGDTALAIISARDAHHIPDNGECHFDVLGYKCMVQDWQSGFVLREKPPFGWNRVHASVRVWIQKYGLENE